MTCGANMLNKENLSYLITSIVMFSRCNNSITASPTSSVGTLVTIWIVGMMVAPSAWPLPFQHTVTDLFQSVDDYTVLEQETRIAILRFATSQIGGYVIALQHNQLCHKSGEIIFHIH